MKHYISFIVFLICTQSLYAQVADTGRILPDSSTAVVVPATNGPDSFSLKPKTVSKTSVDPTLISNNTRWSYEIMSHHPYFGFNARPTIAPPSPVHVVKGKELLFYVILFLLILFGLLKQAFPKYFSDMFRVVFRTTLKQRQVREQLMQTPFPGLMLNIFFVLIAGFYAAFVLQHFNLNPVNNLWLLVLYAALGISAIYFIKYVGIKFSGWLFNLEPAADSYIFIIFIINKMLGILLLPFLILLAFTGGNLYSMALSLSWIMIGGLLVYRFILTYAAIRKEVKVNPFHFFLYLLAFEIAPLLLVYKGLLLFFGINT